MGTSVITGQLTAALNWNSACPLALTKLVDASQLSFQQNFGSGTTLGQYLIDTEYSNQYTITASGTLTLDLTALTQTVNGSTLTTSFGHILGLMIVNTTAITGYAISVGPGASNGFTLPWGGTSPVSKIGAGSLWCNGALFDGWATSGTVKTITITNLTSAGSVVVNFAAIGTSL